MTPEYIFSDEFLRKSQEYLRADFLPRIKCAIRDLSDEQLWWRPNEHSNSIANLMLHLAGNVRQWIVSAVGGKPDARKRDAEFNRREIIPKVEVVNVLENAVNDATAVLGVLSVASLSERRVVQGLDVSVGDAIYHVVEHFSMHTGQILYIAKLVSGKDLHLYAFDEKGNAKEVWKENLTTKEQS